MSFKLKDNRLYRVSYGLPKGSKTISNANITKSLALEFLKNNPARKALFSELPKNIDDLLNPKPRSKKADTNK